MNVTYTNYRREMGSSKMFQLSESVRIPIRRIRALVYRAPVLALRAAIPVKRLRPTFIIAGCGKCATTSIFNYLIQHPAVLQPFLKEVNFFDNNYEKGEAWYAGHFPRLKKGGDAGDVITGEATPYYMFHPLAAERAATHLPDAKVVFLLRDPVERAYSHYVQNRLRKREPLSFEEALRSENDRLGKDAELLKTGRLKRSFAHQHYSYKSRGVYVDQLINWHEFFPETQTLILSYHQFSRDPASVYNQVLEFLGLEPWDLGQYANYLKSKKPQIESHVDSSLRAYFEPHNDRLSSYLGKDLDW